MRCVVLSEGVSAILENRAALDQLVRTLQIVKPNAQIAVQQLSVGRFASLQVVLGNVACNISIWNGGQIEAQSYDLSRQETNQLAAEVKSIADALGVRAATDKLAATLKAKYRVKPGAEGDQVRGNIRMLKLSL